MNRCLIGTIALLLAGCGGGTSAVPQSASSAQVSQSKSWMRPEAKDEDLIYAVGGCGGTCVLSYPKGELVGAISGYAGDVSADCSDGSGNVYISNDSEVVEFKHAGTTPTATFSLPAGDAIGCAVDPNSGKLAVVFSATAIAVFEGSSPTVYNSLLEDAYCGYDNAGNLFVSGFDGEQSGLSELPQGASAFTNIMVAQSVGEPGQIQWDGSYITYESVSPGNYVISRLSVAGSSATIVGQTTLKRVKRRLEQSWLYKGSLIAPYSTRGHANNIGIWKYPQGGYPTKRITNFDGFSKKMMGFFGATISVAK